MLTFLFSIAIHGRCSPICKCGRLYSGSAADHRCSFQLSWWLAEKQLQVHMIYNDQLLFFLLKLQQKCRRFKRWRRSQSPRRHLPFLLPPSPSHFPVMPFSPLPSSSCPLRVRINFVLMVYIFCQCDTDRLL